MNTLDIVLIVILGLAFIAGFRKGLFVTLASLIGLILGLYGAFYFSHFAKGFLNGWFDWPPTTTQWVAFILTFLTIVLILQLIGKFLTKIADFTALGLLNKLLGGVFSTLQYAFIMSVVFMFLGSAVFENLMIPEKMKEESTLYEPIATLAPTLLPNLLEAYDEIHDELQNESGDAINNETPEN